MTSDAFRASLSEAAPPPGVPSALVALWQDARGNWDEAHRIAQQIASPDGAWVHAYLHRKEGDQSNAAYWYRQAGRPIASGSLDDEWLRLVQAFAER